MADQKPAYSIALTLSGRWTITDQWATSYGSFKTRNEAIAFLLELHRAEN
jgi:hypothetical protein